MIYNKIIIIHTTNVIIISIFTYKKVVNIIIKIILKKDLYINIVIIII